MGTNASDIDPEASPDPAELRVTVSRLPSSEIFGVQRHLGPGAIARSWRISDSLLKDATADAVEAYARELGCNPHVASAIASAADELISNGLYDAPVDADGRPRNAHLSREDRVLLEPSEAVVLTCATNGKLLCLAAEDSFGSLSPGRAVESLVHAFSASEDQVSQGSGGAGVGLFQVFRLMHQMVINLAPGHRTEIIGLVEITRSYREYSARPRSLRVWLDRSG